MTQHHSVIFKPDQKTISIHTGATILEAAGQAGIIINNPCGGSGTCGKCMVTLEPGNKQVLACQYPITSDIVVRVPPESRFFQQKILEHGIDVQIKLSPSIIKKYLPQVPTDINDLTSLLTHESPDCVHHVHGSSEALLSKLEQINLQYEKAGITAVLHKLPKDTCESENGFCYDILCLESGDTTDSLFGIAIDIGTTTVVAKLIDMYDGQCKATAAMANPQIKYGDDVISRISFAETESGYNQLHTIIVECINTLIEQLCEKHTVLNTHIYEVSIAGNTTMSHLFLKHPVKQLGQAPYLAYSTDAEDRNAGDMGLEINQCGNIHVIENIAGFVGSDTTAVAVAVGMNSISKMTLVVDIGTNGELILGTKEKIYSASCAAGPALEGARISQGSRAIEGAIERVIIDGDDIEIDVIGNAVARSICGSGLIDAMAVLLELGIVDETGRFKDRDEIRAIQSEAILERVIEHDGEWGFILAHNRETDDKPVIFTQKDIRETQLSKAAIRAGIKLLKKKAGIQSTDIDQILLAGAFGNYIRRKSACRIGLLPDIPREKINYVGNAASTGAQMILLSHTCRQMAAELVKKIEYVEIAHETEFQMIYAECLMFD